MANSSRGRRLSVVAVALIVAASIAAVIVSTATASSPGCDPVDFEIVESKLFTPVDERFTSPLDPPINPAGGTVDHVPADAIVTSIDGLPLRWAATASNGAVYQYFYNAGIGRSLTVSEFRGTGGVQLDRDPTDNGESYPEFILSTLGERAVRVEVGDYVGALTWADPESNGIRPHYLVWSDGLYNYTLIAVMQPEELLTLGREVVCGGKIGT